jgi:hypothetical protein
MASGVSLMLISNVDDVVSYVASGVSFDVNIGDVVS